jgi:hypothetical protein
VTSPDTKSTYLIDTLRSKIPNYRYCLEKYEPNRQYSGKVDLKFRIEANGSVSNSRVDGDSFTQNSKSCIASITSKIEFKAIKNGGFADITQPLHFTSRK